MQRLVILTGCSSGGKSSLLLELATRSHTIVPEAGRRIVTEALQQGHANLPWANPEAFARRAIDVSRNDIAAQGTATGFIFFDRGLIDALAALEHVTGAVDFTDYPELAMFDPLVFIAPPWPEIYVQDSERQHGIAEAIEEYERLRAIYPRLGFKLVELPKVSIFERADFVETTLNG